MFGPKGYSAAAAADAERESEDMEIKARVADARAAIEAGSMDPLERTQLIKICNPAEYSNPGDLVATITPFESLSVEQVGILFPEQRQEYDTWRQQFEGEQGSRILEGHVLGASDNYDTRVPLYVAALNSAGVTDAHAWYVETIKKQEDEMTQFEKDAVTAIINHCKSLNTHDHGAIATFLMGYPTLHDQWARPTPTNSLFANNSGFTFPNYPTYRYHPKGYEPGGCMPRYRLKTTHNVYMNELSTNNRLLGTPKPWASWHRWPGWRIGALATFAFIILDDQFWGIKASLAHHHHHYEAREHHMYGLPSYTADGRMLKGNLVYKMEE